MIKSSLIEKIMTPNPVTVNGNEKLTKVIRQIKEHDFDHIPVVDNERKLLGIISKTDLYQKALTLANSTTGQSFTNKVLNSTAAKDVMTKKTIFVTPQHSVEYAIELLLQGDFHALPVLDNDKLVGIITSKDVLEYITDENLTTV